MRKGEYSKTLDNARLPVGFESRSRDVAAMIVSFARALRIFQGWTLSQTSSYTGLAVSTISGLERWETNPKQETLEALAEVFGVQDRARELQDEVELQIRHPGIGRVDQWEYEEVPSRFPLRVVEAA